MKKHIKTIFIILFISVLSFFAYKIASKINHKKEVAENIKTIPKFSYKNTKGGFFTNENLKRGHATIFIYFNTECEYCNEEAQMIKENITNLKDVELIFVSFENPDKIKKFAQKKQLNIYDCIHFLSDSKVTFASTFDINNLPCLLLYDKNQNLIEQVKGQMKIETLIKKMNLE